MEDFLQIEDKMTASVERKRGISEELFAKGKFFSELWRNGKLVHKEEFTNGVVTAGKNALWDIFFRNQTQIATWYMSLVNNSGWTAFADADTMSSHAGWSEFQDYSGGVRETWTPAAAASGAMTNTTLVEFNITASGTLKGAFIVSNNTLGGTTGTLWCTGAFGSTVPVENGDILKITYAISC